MGKEKEPINSKVRIVSVVIAIAVALIGMIVIAGWHLHVSFLVQVIPGAVPMKYNTALCFFILGVSSAAALTKYPRSILPLIGGAFVALMGLLVIFEYVTNISIGIDTLFFYPWENTLTPYPGRMSIIAAINFFIAGSMLSLLILKPKMLAELIIGYALILSFGMTSLLGYLLGVVYVLPFHLGSQMGIHTALTFTFYSSAMFIYAWRHAPQTRDGYPKRSPGIAVTMFPIFLIGFSASFQSQSVLMRIAALFFALLGVLLLGLVIHKLNHVRIVYKGLILIFIPLVFVLVFVLLVNQVRQTNEQAQLHSAHSKKIISHTNNLSMSMTSAQSGIRGYVITEDAAYLEPYHAAVKQVPEELNQLKILVSNNPEQSAKIERLTLNIKDRLDKMAGTVSLVREGNRDAAIKQIKSGVGKPLLEEFINEMDSFLAEELRIDNMRWQNVQDSWQRFDWVLVAGSSANLLLAVMITFFFTRGISHRIQTLTENAQALGEGKELATPIEGKDEIAHLDSVFHRMAKALRKSQENLELKVKERTTELLQTNELLKAQMSELQKAEENLERQRSFLRQVIDLNPNLIFAKDKEGRFTLVNQAVAKAYGVSVQNLIGKTDADFNFNKEEVEHFRRVDLEVINSGQERHIPEESLTDTEGNTRWLQTVKRPIIMSDGTVEQLLGVATDITERKRINEQLKELNENLEQRISKRTAQLEAANRELEAFSYSVSHDLRAPLRAIDGFSRILQEDYNDKLDDEGRRVIEVIRSSAQQMGQLIDDLLTFSRLGRKRIEHSEINIDALVRDVHAQLIRDINPHQKELRIESLPNASGDRAMIRQVFINLLSNAIKYSAPNESAVIEVGGKSENGENIYFVKDNGVGFDMKYAHKLFGVFQRLHSADEFDGTGVGLAIVQRIIQRHDGRVWAEAEVNKGATFYFTLPHNVEEEDPNEH